MKNKKFWFEIAIISFIAIAIRMFYINFISDDVKSYLLVWMDEITNNGGFKALGLEIGNYNIAYLTFLAIFTYIPLNRVIMIKVLSIIFDFVMAWAGATIITDLLKNKEKKDAIFLLSYGIILFIPTVILNSAMWGQCDSIYVAFVLLSIMFLIRNKYLTSIVMLGIAFAFKLQTVFILPVYGLIYLGKRKFPFYYFFMIPVINFISWLPAILNGRSIKSCLDIYLGQTQTMGNRITLNFINIYNLIFQKNATTIYNYDERIGYIGMISLLIVFLIISVIVIIKKSDIKEEMILLLGIWGVVISTFLLPNMHDRYLYMADVLSIIYVIRYSKNIWVAISINAISMYLYHIYLTGHILHIPPMILAVLFLAVVSYMTWNVFTRILEIDKSNKVKIEG